MLETNNPELDLNQLLEKVGLELSLQQKRNNNQQPEVGHSQEAINDPYLWGQGQLSETLNVAELNANAGAQVTSMLHHRGFIRKIARFMGKVTIYLGRVITIPQRNFNHSILHSLRITLDGIRDMNRTTADLQEQVDQLSKKLHEKSAILNYTKKGLVLQERRVDILLKELRSQMSGSPNVTADCSSGPEAIEITDPLYLAFENEFRGSRDEIRQRLQEYLPLIRECQAGDTGRDILDIGCGRGEWLEIMKAENLVARGIDLNDVLVEECQQRNLDVSKDDALTHLRELPDNSLGAITAFHLIEHLDLDTRIALFDESVRVLKPGGIAIFETPNPQNLLVGSCDFWSDPTHLKPLYPGTHKFLMEYRGFCDVDLLFLHPHDEAQRLPEGEAPQLASRLNELFSCARDYAIIGYKV